MTNIRLRVLSYIVIAYLLIAFTWWTILLYQKNRDALQAKTQLLMMGMAAEGHVKNLEEFQHTTAYLDLQKEYKRQEWMIMGEALVFVISLVIGVWLIHRSYNREIEAANQRRNFLLSITHELKSPISSIRLVLETFIKRNLRKDQVDKFSNSALMETDRLNELVNNLLLAAKVETAYQPTKEKINLTELFKDVISKLATKFPQAKFHFNQSTTTTEINADKLGMSSIAFNLLENAVKYSNGSSKIDIALERQNENILLSVADNGVGISDQNKKQVFDKFYRVGNEDTRKTKGTGLGLYIVKEVVKAHNGKISIHDNQPQGTIFKIKLPVNS